MFPPSRRPPWNRFTFSEQPGFRRRSTNLRKNILEPIEMEDRLRQARHRRRLKRLRRIAAALLEFADQHLSRHRPRSVDLRPQSRSVFELDFNGDLVRFALKPAGCPCSERKRCSITQAISREVVGSDRAMNERLADHELDAVCGRRRVRRCAPLLGGLAPRAKADAAERGDRSPANFCDRRTLLDQVGAGFDERVQFRARRATA